MLQQYLAFEGFAVRLAHDGEAGLREQQNWQSDLIVLDVMMPVLDGLGMLRQLRQHSQVAVLMLTARHDDIDKLLGLELGADDYLTKPFNPRELVARIRAILRRSQGNPPAQSNTLEQQDLQLVPAKQQISLAGQVLELTLCEYKMLALLLEQYDNVVSKEQLCQHALARPLESYDRSVDMHISNLRRKIAASRCAIMTRRGVGYRLSTQPDE